MLEQVSKDKLKGNQIDVKQTNKYLPSKGVLHTPQFTNNFTTGENEEEDDKDDDKDDDYDEEEDKEEIDEED